jgi:hypothetical protein
VDEFETQPQYPDNTQETSATSRRNFLKVAVVSSAAAAAAVGGAGVAASALASRTPSGLSKLLVLNANVVSTQNACFTHTTAPFQQNTSENTFSDNSSLFLFAWFTLPSHTSSDNFHLAFAASTPLPAYLSYQTPTNSVGVYADQSGCPTQQPSNPFFQANSLPTDFTIDAGTSTILVQMHLKGSSVPAGTQLTLTVELTGPGGYDTTATDVAFFA